MITILPNSMTDFASLVRRDGNLANRSASNQRNPDEIIRILSLINVSARVHQGQLQIRKKTRYVKITCSTAITMINKAFDIHWLDDRLSRTEVILRREIDTLIPRIQCVFPCLMKPCFEYSQSKRTFTIQFKLSNDVIQLNRLAQTAGFRLPEEMLTKNRKVLGYDPSEEKKEEKKELPAEEKKEEIQYEEDEDNELPDEEKKELPDEKKKEEIQYEEDEDNELPDEEKKELPDDEADEKMNQLSLD